MPTVNDVCCYLDQLSPPHLAEDWDNTGLLMGERRAEVRSVLTCLTLTPDVADESIAAAVGLIITHHPILFRGRKQLTDDDAEGRMLLSLIRAGIAVYSAHTRFDSAVDGVNASLARDFGLQQTAALRPIGEAPMPGAGRHGTLPTPVAFDAFLRTVCRAVHADRLEFVGPAHLPVRHVGVACGSAAEFLDDAARLGCDTFVTGEARFHAALEAQTRGIRLILTGHYCSERPAMERLAETLAAEFPGITAMVSQRESDPLQLFRLDSHATHH